MTVERFVKIGLNHLRKFLPKRWSKIQDQLDETGWKWDPKLSTELDRVDSSISLTKGKIEESDSRESEPDKKGGV
jgi:hypothetical protein